MNNNIKYIEIYLIQKFKKYNKYKIKKWKNVFIIIA
jgi:hypothetical protein